MEFRVRMFRWRAPQGDPTAPAPPFWDPHAPQTEQRRNPGQRDSSKISQLQSQSDRHGRDHVPEPVQQGDPEIHTLATTPQVSRRCPRRLAAWKSLREVDAGGGRGGLALPTLDLRVQTGGGSVAPCARRDRQGLVHDRDASVSIASRTTGRIHGFPGRCGRVVPAPCTDYEGRTAHCKEGPLRRSVSSTATAVSSCRFTASTTR